jgi:hypothetical protein
MKNLLLIFSIFLFIASCSNKEDMPKNILPRQKMQDIMWDISRAEEFLNSYVIYRDTSIDRAAESQKWYEKIYQIHKVTKKDFDRSYAYYKDHPVLLKEILDSLSKKTAPAPPGQAFQRPKDSLKLTSKDTLVKNDTPFFFNKRRLMDTLTRRRMDTLARKRIIKKIAAP